MEHTDWNCSVCIPYYYRIFLMRRMSGGGAGGAGNVFNVGKAKARLFDKDNEGKSHFQGCGWIV